MFTLRLLDQETRQHLLLVLPSSVKTTGRACTVARLAAVFSSLPTGRHRPLLPTTSPETSTERRQAPFPTSSSLAWIHAGRRCCQALGPPRREHRRFSPPPLIFFLPSTMKPLLVILDEIPGRSGHHRGHCKKKSKSEIINFDIENCRRACNSRPWCSQVGTGPPSSSRSHRSRHYPSPDQPQSPTHAGASFARDRPHCRAIIQHRRRETPSRGEFSSSYITASFDTCRMKITWGVG